MNALKFTNIAGLYSKASKNQRTLMSSITLDEKSKGLNTQMKILNLGHGLAGKNMCESLSACTRTACVLTQITKQLHSQRCKDKEEKHEEKTQIPHLQRDNRGWEGFSQRTSAQTHPQKK